MKAKYLIFFILVLLISINASADDTLTLRPNANGTYTEATPSPAVANYLNVDEISPDEDTTYNYYTGYEPTHPIDIFGIQDHTAETEDIKYITITTRAKESIRTLSPSRQVRAVIELNSTLYYGGWHDIEQVWTGSEWYYWDNYTYTFIQNPDTTTTWTWTDVDNIKSGYQINNKNSADYWTGVTQSYIVVSYNNTIPSLPTNQTDLGNKLINNTPTITWTEGTDSDGDTVTTYIYIGENAAFMILEGSTTDETYNLGTNNTLLDGQTYNYTLRSWDGYEFSNYTIADTFTINSVPTIPSLIPEPDYHLNQSITVQWSNSTDNDNDTIYYDVRIGTTSGGTDILNETLLTNESNSFNISQFKTYYWSVRGNDTYELSDWSTEDSFSVTNDVPLISNITISPDPTAVEDDLTALNDTVTDADGDPITLYYRWYKNNVLQSDLTTSIVNSTNTSNGELWKVGIIPNDGYENGTEVQSQTVEIGSSNSAPTATGVSINISYPIKRYVNFSITGLNASDPNGDLCRIEVGSSSGASDLGNSTYMNASIANVTIAMPYYDGLEHTLYVRLNDSNLTSQEYLATITSDITLPILNSESRSPATGTQGASFGITINTTSINSTIKTVTASVSRPDATTANWSMSNTVNDTWYYSYTSTSDIGTYTINSYTITDASDNVDTINSALSFTITAAVLIEGGGGGGGGGTTIIQVGDISDLTLTPPRLDTYALYGGFGEDRVLKYRFIANRNVTSCTVEPTEEHNGVATCEITDGYIVDVHLTINDSRGYSGTLTVRDSDEFVATSDLIVRVIDIGAHIEIVNIPVGEAIASSLNLFFASENGVLVGIRAWGVGATIGFLGLALFKSDLFE